MLSSTQVSGAGCTDNSQNERLSNKCLLDMVNGSVVTQRSAAVIDYRLKREGYRNGLGFPGGVHSFSFQPHIIPLLTYSTDINGGEINKPLVLGAFTFKYSGDGALVRKKGMVAGVAVGGSGRYIYGEGRYFDFRLNAAQEHSPEYHLGITTLSASGCSKNHIKNWWYFDACASTRRIKKDLSDERSRAFSLSTSKVFSTPKFGQSEVFVGFRRYFNDNYRSYEQNQLTTGIDTIYQNGLYSSVHFSFGEPLQNQLAMRREVNALIGMSVAGKPLSILAGYKVEDGGLLLGFEREEDTTYINVSFGVWQNIKISVGYTKTQSTIDYFDFSEPVFEVHFSAIEF